MHNLAGGDLFAQHEKERSYMGEYVKVASLGALPPNERLSTWVSGIRVMLVNVGGTVYGVDEQCTHMECSLMEGPLKGTMIGCPCHLAAFDLTDGRVVRSPATVPLPTWNVKVEDGDIYVEERPPEAV